MDQIEAWPEDPELTDEMEMRGRCVCEKGAEGGRNMVVSFRSASSVGLVKTQVGAADHAPARSSGRVSVLISGVGVVGPGVVEIWAGLGEDEAHDAGVDVMEGGGVMALGEAMLEDGNVGGAMVGGGGGGH